MPHIIQKRIIQREAFREGADITFNLSRSRHTIRNARLFVKGKMDLSASGVSAKPGGIYRLIENLSYRYAGFDPSQDAVYDEQQRYDVPGWLFGFNPRNSTTPYDEDRLNIAINPYSPLAAECDNFADVNPTTLTSQQFFFNLELPFELFAGVFPSDFRADMSAVDNVEFIVRCGRLADCFTDAGAAGEITDATIYLQIEEIVPANRLTGAASAEVPQAFMRTSVQEIPNDSDNDRDVRRANFNGQLHYMAVLTTDEDGEFKDSDVDAPNALRDPDNFYLQNVRIEREGDLVYELDALQIRRDNVEMLPYHRKPNGQHLLQNSGVFFVAPCWRDALTRIKITDMPYLGRGDDSSLIIISRKKPNGGNGKIYLVRNEVFPSVPLAAESRAYSDQSNEERQTATSQAAITRDNNISNAKRQAASEAGVIR